MKNGRFSLLAAVLLTLSGVVYAQQDTAGQPPQNTADNSAQQRAAEKTGGSLPQDTATYLYRATKIVGLTIVTQDQTKAGSVSDIVIKQDGGISFLLAELDGYPGLAKGTYLLAADSVELSGEDLRIASRQSAARVVDKLLIRQYFSEGAIRSSRLVGTDAVGSGGTVLGKIEDIVVDMRKNRVAYIVLEKSGFLGIGRKLYAVPYGDLSYDFNTETARIAADETQLEDTQGFNPDIWPQKANPEWKSPQQSETERQSPASPPSAPESRK